MGEYVEVNGVRTWYDTFGGGAGEPLVLLHGGICTNETWGAQAPALAEHFRVLAPERRGHGHTPDVEGPLSYGVMTDDTIAFLDAVLGGPAHLVGWSDGGVVGLLVAIRRPDLVRRLVLIGASTDVSGLAPGGPAELEADSDELEGLRSMYESATPDGADHWPVVFAKVNAMWTTGHHIPTADVAAVQARTLVLVGDDDAVTLEHTVELYHTLPDAELAVVPGTSHALGLEKPGLVNRVIGDFLRKDPVPTLMPNRRRRRHIADEVVRH
jgi:pimeloyl-ACP methyl ester carboxylesterase